MEKVYKIVNEIGNPQSSNYRKWLSTEEINELTKPTETAILTVTRWLIKNGVQFELSKTGDSLFTQMSISKAEKLLNTKFYLLNNFKTMQSKNRAQDFIIPEEIAEHLQSILGVHDLPLQP
eukprot:gene16130-4890_t